MYWLHAYMTWNIWVALVIFVVSLVCLAFLILHIIRDTTGNVIEKIIKAYWQKPASEIPEEVVRLVTTKLEVKAANGTIIEVDFNPGEGLSVFLERLRQHIALLPGGPQKYKTFEVGEKQITIFPGTADDEDDDD